MYKLRTDYRKFFKNKDDEERERYYYPEVYKPLIEIDYCQDMTDPHSMFQLDRTFTVLDWKFAEKIGKKLDFNKM